MKAPDLFAVYRAKADEVAIFAEGHEAGIISVREAIALHAALGEAIRISSLATSMAEGAR